MELLKRSLIKCKGCLATRALHLSRAAPYCAAVRVDGAGENVNGEEEAAGGAPDPLDPERGGWARRVVTALQPSGALHAGNYFAALRRAGRLAAAGEDVTLFVADLHVLTTAHDAAALRRRVLDVAAAALASGAPRVFAQSAVPRHAELCWLLGCLASPARLAALPQFREKAANMKNVPLGLMLYPVLQAADVLVYRGTHVLVGVDQAQHLQLAATLARAFARHYGPAFPAPRALMPDDGSDRIRSLRAPHKKMSKSDPDRRACLLLADDAAAIALKVRKAVTDCTPEVTWEPEKRPGVANLIRLHCLAAGLAPAAAVRAAAGLTTDQYKGLVAAALEAELAPVRERYLRLRAEPGLLAAELAAGAEHARRRADETYADVAARAGLAAPALPPPARVTAAAAAAAAAD